MQKYRFTDDEGSFLLNNPEQMSYLYFPLANMEGVMSSITPELSGDSKTSQNTFLLSPVSSEDLHNNKSSRNFWCKINHTSIWSATGKSAWQQAKKFSKDKEETQLEAGFLWHKITRISKEFGLKAGITSFVPTNDDKVELMKVELSNIGSEPITLEPVAAIPLYCRSADNIRDHRHVTSLLHRIEVLDRGIIVNPTLTFDERGHKINEIVYGVLGGNDSVFPSKFYPTVDSFIGEGGSFENPRALQDDRLNPMKSGDKINGYEAFGGLGFEEIVLQPDESKVYIIALGYGNTKEDFIVYGEKYLSEKAFHKAFEEMKAYWKTQLNVRFETGDEKFNHWMRWVTIQPILRRIYGCSFLPHHDYGKGGRGWRDLWQDCLALLLMDPGEVRTLLKENFQGVRMDGTNATIIGKKRGEFIADRNNITRVWMDHGVWPLITTYLYIQQSGDIEFLLENVPYFKDMQTVRGEEKDTLWTEEQGQICLTKDNQPYLGTILEHLLIQHLTAFYDVGEHNHIRLRGADWNDALDMAKDKGESVTFTALYGDNLEILADLIDVLESRGFTDIELAKEMKVLIGNEDSYEDYKKKRSILMEFCMSTKHRVSGDIISIPARTLSKTLRSMGQFIKEHIRKTEWISDGKEAFWFNGYYDNLGQRVEGVYDLGVRMMLPSQVFTIMSGTATDEQVKAITKAVDQYLYIKEIGGYRLNTDFKEVNLNLGRMFGFAYGHKENGAVFCHMAVMYAYALYARGFVKEGFKVIDTLYSHSMNFEKSKIYPGIPEYFDDKGRGMYHYLTGAASWLMLTLIQQVFGVVGKMGDLTFEPKLLKCQFNEKSRAGIFFDFGERHFHVEYVNEEGLDYGEYRVVKVEGNLGKDFIENNLVIKREVIESLQKDKVYELTVTLGHKEKMNEYRE
ncbi:MAG: cellobiose phosphorylase [Epulopiscium sp.]|nr:cellobiose phosphorylase [Candidatus Epulonipiscium sp.]